MMKIISGGQSGVDRAALDFCLNKNINCGGWCPKGRKSEEGRIPDIYPLTETKTTDYEERTRLNVMDSDGTMIIFMDNMDTGTILTKTLLIELKKPFLLVNLSNKIKPESIIKWIENNHIKILNIAGPRESNQPGIYQLTLEFLRMVFVDITKF